MHDSMPAKTPTNDYCYTKRGRNGYDHDEVENDEQMNKLKGVVCQQNGHWGAQIYANHQRIWLGTFKSQTEAAMAYDSATIKLRTGSEIHPNFPWNHHEEVQFQSHYSIETVLTMIRNGTYQSKFATFQSSNQGHDHNYVNVIKGGGGGEEKFCCTQSLLFSKELTPSDVGKLNRLVIPKKYADTYFPCNGNNNNNDDDDKCIDIEVVFYDKLMQLWKFRYCYWKSSQSYVFTRGWNQFVKDKKLKARDVVAFYMCQQGGEVFSLIDVIYNNDNINANAVADDQRRRHCFGDGEQILGICSEVEEDEGQDGMEEDFNGLHLENNNNNNDINAQRRGLRLFGVSIN